MDSNSQLLPCQTRIISVNCKGITNNKIFIQQDTLQKDIFNNYLQEARFLQQNYYENFADWNIFPKNNINFLKNYVGSACFFRPIYITKDMEYKYEDEKHTTLIENIQSKISTHAEGFENVHCIVLYNIIFPTKEEIDKRIELLIKTKSTENANEGNNYELKRIPIFKIKRKIGEIEDEWFIDLDFRVYKSWTDYLENNKLPPCTMVLPKDGKYQPDPEQPYTKSETYVWIEYQQSPASSSNFMLKCLDIGSAVLSAGIAGAAFFTPVGPVMFGLGKINKHKNIFLFKGVF